MPKYLVARLDETPGVPCPCGTARRAFRVPENTTASVHLVEISEDARPHYHKRQTEIYVIIEGEGHVELDGRLEPVRPLAAIMIRPGCRHRAVGKMKILNGVIPPFDTADEFFDP